MDEQTALTANFVEKSTAPKGEKQPRRLSGRLGTAGVAFSTVAFLSPLGATTGNVPLVIGYGNGLGAPLAFVAMGVLLGLFAVGYMALVRHVPRPGAFYAYISASLGRRIGLACGGESVVFYLLVMVSISAFSAVQTQELLENAFGFDALPWWVYSVLYIAVLSLFCYRGIDLSVRLVGVVVVIELLVVLTFNLTTVVRGGPDGYLPESFTMGEFTSGSLSIALLFAICTITGFESTAIYREESRDPGRTIPRATYLVVLGLALFYTFTAWCMIVAVGRGIPETAAENPVTVFIDALALTFGRTVVVWIQLLIVTSCLASALTITNVASRYVYSLGVDRVLPRSLGLAHPRYGSPHRALFVAATIAIVSTLAAVVAGVGPVEIYSQISGVIVIGFEAMLLLVSLSAVIYFRKHTIPGASVWSTLVAPSLSIVVFAVLLVFTLGRIETLTGELSGLTPIIGGLLVAGAVGGFGYASWAAKHKPELYIRIGRSTE
jgi:amino acid transporter